MDSEYSHRKLSHLRKVLERSGPFCRPDFEPSSESLKFLMQTCKILVIGAGGLGCECLKNLSLMGFRQMHIIDMDIIDLSNLNRQFLFRHKDIGASKSETAAKFINDRIPGCNVIPHFCKIQDKNEDFYRQFHIIICGLDSIIARRWINGMLVSLLIYENGILDQSTVIPLVDGGTEGFKGNIRVVLPGLTACIECTLDLYPPQITYPLCTIANTPRLPEHCIEYVKVIQWPKENPFDCSIDGDDPQHINWIYEKSMERAVNFGIQGLTYRLVQGVVKNIIPAVASTNAVIASICCTEVFKLASSCSPSLNNYMGVRDSENFSSVEKLENFWENNGYHFGESPKGCNFWENLHGHWTSEKNKCTIASIVGSLYMSVQTTPFDATSSIEPFLHPSTPRDILQEVSNQVTTTWHYTKRCREIYDLSLLSVVLHHQAHCIKKFRRFTTSYLYK